VVPLYPEKARSERLEGEVQVCYYIDKKGRPYRIAVRNSTNRVFERPAVKAVRASSYAPLEKGARISGIKSCRTFRFTLESVVDG
jgi:TonB family protein